MTPSPVVTIGMDGVYLGHRTADRAIEEARKHQLRHVYTFEPLLDPCSLQTDRFQELYHGMRR